MKQYYLFYKPYNVLCQFTPENEGDKTLSDYLNISSDVYPVGRLDKDSEGLLVLSNDTALNNKLLNPRSKIAKTYWVQIEGIPDEIFFNSLKSGPKINIKGKMYRSLPVIGSILENPKVLPRDPPIRFRKSIPSSWIEIKIQEGKNRQVRKICASLGFPVLRLIRVGISNLDLGDLLPGMARQIKGSDISFIHNS